MKLLPINAHGDTHKGQVRPHNEDNYYVMPPDFDREAIIHHGQLYVVADGVGGNKGGKQASLLATTRIPDYYYNSTGQNIETNISLAIQSAGRDILNEANRNPDLNNMGCTVAAVVIKDNIAYIAHLGDARVYLLRRGKFKALTKDHTWVQEQVEAGTLTEEEARNHPNRNVITKSLGSATIPPPTLHSVPLQDGDRLLLCSDGLAGVVPDPQIAHIMAQNNDPRRTVPTLIQQANREGGPDNIAAVVIHVGQKAAMPVAAPVAPRRRSGAVLPVLFIFVIGIAILLFTQLNNGPAALAPQPGGTTTNGSQTSPAGDNSGSDAAVTNDSLVVDPTSTVRPASEANGYDEPDDLEDGAPPPTTGPVVATPIPVSTTAPPAPPPITLHAPTCQDEFQPGSQPQFEWRWAGSLAAGEYLEVRFQLGGEWIGRSGQVTQPASGENWSFPVALDGLGAGQYNWRVYHMAADRQTVRNQSANGCFNIAQPAHQPPEPGNTPVPDPTPTDPRG